MSTASVTKHTPGAKVIDDWTERGELNTRSALADARLNYGRPYQYKWAAVTQVTPRYDTISPEDQKSAEGLADLGEQALSTSDQAPQVTPAPTSVASGMVWYQDNVLKQTHEFPEDTVQVAPQVTPDLLKRIERCLQVAAVAQVDNAIGIEANNLIKELRGELCSVRQNAVVTNADRSTGS